MKCINKCVSAVLLTAAVILGSTGCQKDTTLYTAEYEKENYNQSLYQGTFFAEDLCVTDTDISLEGYSTDTALHAAGLFDLTNRRVLYAQTMFEKIYPASTTKIMTAYLALKYGNLDDVVTVSENALDLEDGSSVCWLKAGDQLTLRDLLYGLMLQSGNDSAVAIAEHISGSEEAFVELMNEEAARLGATQTHFMNPHGLHEEEHYTTAYDLYLIFNACIQMEQFLEVISQSSYTADVMNPALGTRTLTWTPTNYYFLGKASAPEGVRVIGGKTGTTDQAGCCLILYEEDSEGNAYISVVMGAKDKSTLYLDMTGLMQVGIVNR